MVQDGHLSIDPVKNPAVLDTGTWDREAAAKLITEAADDIWNRFGSPTFAGETSGKGGAARIVDSSTRTSVSPALQSASQQGRAHWS